MSITPKFLLGIVLRLRDGARRGARESGKKSDAFMALAYEHVYETLKERIDRADGTEPVNTEPYNPVLDPRLSDKVNELASAARDYIRATGFETPEKYQLSDTRPGNTNRYGAKLQAAIDALKRGP